VGAWYTRTNGNDITSPGAPGDPYYDKGLFLSIPLGTLLTRDTQATARMSIAPWARDVGAMVVSPLDLHRLMEKPLILDAHEHDGLAMLGDMDDDYHRSPGSGPRVGSPQARDQSRYISPPLRGAGRYHSQP
jgi:hypothetical protein